MVRQKKLLKSKFPTTLRISIFIVIFRKIGREQPNAASFMKIGLLDLEILGGEILL